MNVQPVRIIKAFVLAVIFGAMFWLFLELIQTTVVNLRFSCCERCGNILFDREQPILAFCAALSLLVFAFLKIKGWKGILKTLAVSFSCFLLYWLMTLVSGQNHEECSLLNYPNGRLPSLNEIVMLVVSGFWAGICAAALMIYQGFWAIISKKSEV